MPLCLFCTQVCLYVRLVSRHNGAVAAVVDLLLTGLQKMCLLAQMSTGGKPVNIALKELKAKRAARDRSGSSFNGSSASISETPSGFGWPGSLNGSSSCIGLSGTAGGSSLASSPAAATVNLLLQLSPSSRAHSKCPPHQGAVLTDLQRYSCFIKAAASSGRLGSSFRRRAEGNAHFSGVLQMPSRDD